MNTPYDFSSDDGNDDWDIKKAKLKLEAIPDKLICEALQEQDIFSGGGNIIKNEELYRFRIHPNSIVGIIPALKVKKLMAEARIYSFQFLEWKRNYELKEHWKAHTEKVCLQYHIPLTKKYTGLKNGQVIFVRIAQFFMSKKGFIIYHPLALTPSLPRRRARP